MQVHQALQDLVGPALDRGLRDGAVLLAVLAQRAAREVLFGIDEPVCASVQGFDAAAADDDDAVALAVIPALRWPCTPFLQAPFSRAACARTSVMKLIVAVLASYHQSWNFIMFLCVSCLRTLGGCQKGEAWFDGGASACCRLQRRVCCWPQTQCTHLLLQLRAVLDPFISC